MLSTSVNSFLHQYNQDGYVIVRDVLDDATIADAQRHEAWFRSQHPGATAEQLHNQLTDARDPFYFHLCRNPRLLDIAEQFIGPDIAVFATGYIFKPPHSDLKILWHQDGSYWPLEPMEVVTLWVAITPSTPANGCMRMIPGTHRMDLHPLQTDRSERNLLNSRIDPVLVDESQAVDLVLRPGDVSIHHPNIIHGSGANGSDDWRVNLVIRYIPTSTRITRSPWERAFWARGNVVPGLNKYLPEPTWTPEKYLRFEGCERYA
jgi:ectoine hydroxylase-related dioxygenase (phytanoyl-CoA dioxygenase family)